VLALWGAGCGAGDTVAPYTEPAPACRSVDEYLTDLYAVIDEGGVSALATTIRDRIPDETRRDLVDALLRLLSGFAEGRFTALAGDLDGLGEQGGLQKTLAVVVRYLADGAGPEQSGPDLAFLAMLRRAVATCPGEPVFALFAELTRDEALVDALVAALGSETLRELVSGLSLEGEGGREALQLLVRNLLVSASSPSFDLDGLLSLLSVLLGERAEEPPLSELVSGLRRVFSEPEALGALQGTLVCLRQVDPELSLGGFLYDLVTSGLLAELGPGVVEIPRSALDLLTDALDFLSADAVSRRALKTTLVALLEAEVAPPVLGDIATLLEREALSGVFELVSDVASKTCHVGGGR
jgi:hypothetical protein